MAEHREHWKKAGVEGDQEGVAPDAGVARSQSNDPLAELARLIDEDPFADFDRERNRSIFQGDRTDIEWEVESSVEALAAEHESVPVFQEKVETYADNPRGNPHGEAPADYLARFSGLAQTEYVQQPETELNRAPGIGGDPDWAPAFPVAADEPDHSAYDPVAALEAHLLGQDVSADGVPGDGVEDDEYRGFQGIHEFRPSQPEWPDPSSGFSYPGDDFPARDLDPDADPLDGELNPFAQSFHAEPADTDLGSDDGGDLDNWDDATPVIPAYEDEDPPSRRSKRGLVVLGSLVGLVVLGGAVALGYRGLSGGSEGQPPIIRADSSPAKVMAEDDSEVDSNGGSKLVYDRIDGNEPQQEERLVSREEPVFDVVGRDGQFTGTNPGGEIALRGGAGESRVGAGGNGANQPRRVRTVVVRPDGTVVGPTEEAADVAASEPQPVPAAPQAPQVSQQDEGSGAAIEERSSALNDAEANADGAGAVATSQPAEPVSTTAVAEEESSQPASGEPLRIIPEGTADGNGGSQSSPADNDEAEIARAPTANQTEQALEQPSESSAGTAASFPSGSYVVQVASTRNEDDAHNLASRVTQQHRDLLDAYQTGIQEADLGDRGVFYRVGVGPMNDRSDATALCERMQSAGQDCFVRQN